MAGVLAAVILGSVLLASAADAQVPGLNGRVAFERSGPDGGIYTMNADGTDQVDVTPDDAFANSVAFSPDGTKIAFRSIRDSAPRVYVADVDGSDPIRLTQDTAWEGLPVFSPDGSKIAFVTNRDGDDEIYSVDLDGANLTRLTNDPTAADDWFSYSPDGSKIAYTRGTTDQAEIFVMNADGSNPVALTSDATGDFDPEYSPDGSKIAFATNRDGTLKAYVMDADGSSPTPIPTAAAFVGAAPSFSPDGLHIVYNDADGPGRIRVLTLATGEDHVIGEVADAGDSFPVWHSISRPPTCAPAALQAPFGSSAQVQLTCADPDDEPFTTEIATQPAHGSATLDAQHTLAFTPAVGFGGADELRLTVRDRRGAASQPVVPITVGDDPNPPPPVTTPTVPTAVPPVTTPTVTTIAPHPDPPVALSLSAVRLSRGTLRRTRPAKLAYTLSRAASVRLTLARAVRGRGTTKRCVRVTRRNRGGKPCVRFVEAGSVTFAGRSGSNTRTIGRRFAHRTLKAGRYRLTISTVEPYASPTMTASSTKTLRLVVAR